MNSEYDTFRGRNGILPKMNKYHSKKFFFSFFEPIMENIHDSNEVLWNNIVSN